MVSIAILLSVLSTGGFGYYTSRKIIAQDVEKVKLINLVQLKAAKIEKVIHSGIEVSKTLAQDATFMEWFAENEKDEKLGKLAKQKLTFISRELGYPVAFAANINTLNFWTHGNKLTDVLSENDPGDSWFFEFLKMEYSVKINVGFNRDLNKMFVWINTLMGTPDNPIGIAGVGLPFEETLHDFTEHQFEEYGKVWMINQKGIIQIDEQVENIGKEIRDFVPSAIIDNFLRGGGEIGIQKYDHDDLREIVFAMKRIEDTDSIIIIRVLKTRWLWSILTPYFFAVINSGLITLILFSSIFALVSIFTMRILTRLSKTILALGEESFETALCKTDTLRKDEFGDIARGLEITRTKLSEAYRTLQVKEEEYRTLVENINLGVFRGLHGKPITANSAYLKIFGYDSFEEFMKVDQLPHYDPEDRNKFFSLLQENGECKNFEMKIRRKDGNLIYGALSARAQYDDKKNIKWVDGVLEDITERKEAEKMLRGLNASFERFVPKQFLNRIAKDGIEKIHLGNAESDFITILFSDIRSFTNLSENMSPQNVLNFLNAYFKRMNKPIHKNNGFVDKFIGDAIMALFDCPEGTDHTDANDAVKAAVGMQVALREYNKHRRNTGYIPISIGIGIHSGPVVIGTVGSEDRMDSTVLGDTVNMTSRLEGLTKHYNSQIVISSETYQFLEKDSAFLCKELDFVSVKGKDKPEIIYDVFNSNPEDIRDLKQQTLPSYNEGLLNYHSRNWEEALKLFNKCLKVYPGDTVSKIYVERCTQFKNDPPPLGWDGVSRLKQK